MSDATATSETAASGAGAPAGSVPVVTVVTPVYNGDRYLDELIRSVRAQDLPNVEHLVIDDGSKDDGATVAILSRHPHLRWWTRPNRGQYATLNEGIAAARGDWICIVSADDILAGPSALSDLLRTIRPGERVDAVYGRTRLVDGAGLELAGQDGRLDESAPPWVNRHFLVIHHCSMLVDRRFLLAHDLFFDTSLRYTGDWDWIIRILQRGRARFTDVVVSKYRVHGEQTRQTTTRRKLEEEDRQVLARHGSSMALRRALIAWSRLRRLAALARSGGSGAALAAMRRFLHRT